jgi:hypothetical protein
MRHRRHSDRATTRVATLLQPHPPTNWGFLFLREPGAVRAGRAVGRTLLQIGAIAMLVWALAWLVTA